MKENILKHGLVTRLRSPSVCEGGISHGMMTDEDPIPFSKLVGLGAGPDPSQENLLMQRWEHKVTDTAELRERIEKVAQGLHLYSGRNTNYRGKRQAFFSLNQVKDCLFSLLPA